MSDLQLAELHDALGDDGLVKMSWNRLHGWCIIATNSAGISFAGKDSSLAKVAERCIEVLKGRPERVEKPERVSFVETPPNEEIADIVVIDDGRNRYSLTKNRFGSCVHDINVMSLALIISDVIDRRGTGDLLMVWKRANLEPVRGDK